MKKKKAEAEKKAAYQEGVEKGREEGAAQTRKAYTLMAQALEEKNPEALKKILDELEPIKGNLSQEAQKEYEKFKAENEKQLKQKLAQAERDVERAKEKAKKKAAPAQPMPRMEQPAAPA